MAFNLVTNANRGGRREIRDVSHNVGVWNGRRWEKWSRVNGPFHDTDSLEVGYHEIERKVRGTDMLLERKTVFSWVAKRGLQHVDDVTNVPHVEACPGVDGFRKNHQTRVVICRFGQRVEHSGFAHADIAENGNTQQARPVDTRGTVEVRMKRTRRTAFTGADTLHNEMNRRIRTQKGWRRTELRVCMTMEIRKIYK
jgi:hypothetical protein